MHRFWNPGPGPAWLLEVIAPAGFETYLVELAEAGDPGRRPELAAKYGVSYSSDQVAELISRHASIGPLPSAICRSSVG